MNYTTDRVGPAVGPLRATISFIIRLHDQFFDLLNRLLDGWFIGFAARFSFASVLGYFYLTSGFLKLGDGFFGFLFPSVGAFAAIIPPIIEQAEYDVSAIAFFPWHVIVILGTWAEILLPVMIAIGLFTRVSALGMIVFIAVHSYVDIAFHGLEKKFVGAMFDQAPIAMIFDQRLLWIFVLLVLVVRGGGKLSLDHIVKRFR